MSAFDNKMKEALYKKELLVCFLSLVLVSLTTESQIVKAQFTEDGRPFIVASPINILSPSNITYNSSLLILNVTFKLLLGVNCVELCYSIDGHDNITITPTATRQLIEATITYKNGTTVKGNATFVPYIISGWATLPKLAEGSHKLTVYTRYNANNIIGLDNSTSYFTIDTNLQQEIPEFPRWIILPFFVLSTLSVMFIKRKLFQN
jgi:hypothetical protein